MRKLLLFLVSLMGVYICVFSQDFTLSPLPSVGQDENYFLRKSSEDFQNQQYFDAVEDVRQYLIKGGRDSSQAYFLAGNAYFGLNDMNRAIKAYQISVDANPKEAGGSLCNIGYAYQILSNDSLAVNYYKQSLAVESKCFECYMNMGTIYAQKGDYKTAIDCFVKCLKISPDTAAYENLGISYFNLGKYNKSIKQYKKSIKFYPTQTAYSHIGNLYILKDKPKKALPYFDKAIQIAPDAHAYWGVGECYLLIGQVEKSIENLLASIAIEPTSVTYKSLGHAYLSKNETSEAIKAFCDAIRLDDKDDEAYVQLGVIYDQQQGHEVALTYFKQAAQLGNTDAIQWLQQNGYALP